MCLVGILAGVATRPTLPQQIPAAIELDLDRPQPLLICIESLGVLAVRLFALPQIVLLGDQALDPSRNALVAHDWIVNGGARIALCRIGTPSSMRSPISSIPGRTSGSRRSDTAGKTQRDPRAPPSCQRIGGRAVGRSDRPLARSSNGAPDRGVRRLRVPLLTSCIP